jgi:hypothetical protein
MSKKKKKIIVEITLLGGNVYLTKHPKGVTVVVKDYNCDIHDGLDGSEIRRDKDGSTYLYRKVKK